MELMGVLMKRLKAPLSAWHKHKRSGLWTMSRNGRQQSAGGAPARPLRKGTHDKSWESVPMQSAGNVCVGCGGGGGEGDGLGGGAPDEGDDLEFCHLDGNGFVASYTQSA